MDKLKRNETIIVKIEDGISDVYYSPDNVKIIIVDYDDIDSNEEIFCPNCEEEIVTDFEDENGCRVCSKCGFNFDLLDDNLE